MIVESVLGNVAEPDWTERLSTAKVDDLVLDQWEAQKSRLRKATSLGTELALSLSRGYGCATATSWPGTNSPGLRWWPGSPSAR